MTSVTHESTSLWGDRSANVESEVGGVSVLGVVIFACMVAVALLGIVLASRPRAGGDGGTPGEDAAGFGGPAEVLGDALVSGTTDAGRRAGRARGHHVRRQHGAHHSGGHHGHSGFSGGGGHHGGGGFSGGHH